MYLLTVAYRSARPNIASNEDMYVDCPVMSGPRLARFQMTIRGIRYYFTRVSKHDVTDTSDQNIFDCHQQTVSSQDWAMSVLIVF